MYLKPIDTVASISPEEFRRNYFDTKTPVIIKDMAKQWPAYEKWDWSYLKAAAGKTQVGIYNNVKSDAFTPVNKADDYTEFGNYLDMIAKGPAEWRIFLFNVFKHAPQLTKDFEWPDNYMKRFVKAVPMLFAGGQGSITHMHFDMDLSHILHTQFVGRKRVLLFPYEEQYNLYRKPFEVLSLVDFSHYYDPKRSKIDYQRFPAVHSARGYDFIMEHGDTLFMPAGYWHHMEYLDSGFAMSLRALQSSLSGKLHGAWNLVGMRNIDTLMKKTMPKAWYHWKEKKIFGHAPVHGEDEHLYDWSHLH